MTAQEIGPCVCHAAALYAGIDLHLKPRLNSNILRDK